MDAIFSNAGLLAGLGLLSAVAVRTWRGLQRWCDDCQRLKSTWRQSLTGFEQELNSRRSLKVEPHPPAAWNGYRRFVVDRKIAEAENIHSYYLTPEDGRALPTFEPGQYLTLKLTPPGTKLPLVRCYSLSDRPHAEYFRITVKSVGKASNYLHEHIQPGDVIYAQAPRGDYHLQKNDSRPIVLVAAGIGITPVFSMLNTLLHEPSSRPVVLFYGVRNSAEHAFKQPLEHLARQNSRFHYVPCYSQPLPSDRAGQDYAAAQRVDLALIKKLVQNPALPFYLCGPGSFMESIVPGLKAWGVAESDVHYEAFGPSTVKRMHEPSVETNIANSATRVIYKRSHKTTIWNGADSSLLEQAESQEISLPSGCRSGNCGMCAVKLLAGDVKYHHKPSCDIPAGACLTCVAQPASDDLILDA